jgi:methylenetetrahydrofolate dehydrogenase (NADP+)/methenyltetrahydrofolate cyclohydrolase
MMKILDGKKLSEEILAGLATKVKSRNLKLALAVISVGRNLVSEKYQRQKQRVCEKIGIDFEKHNFPMAIRERQLVAAIKKVGARKQISGIVVQLPLPKHLSDNLILNSILPAKDPDCLTGDNSGKFYQGEPIILPPVAAAIKRLFEKYKIKIAGKTAVVVGAGRLVGLPVSLWLVQQGATVTVCNRLTKGLAGFTRQADMLISGAGQPNLIKGSMIKSGAIVIDCGTSVESGKLVGDIQTESVIKKAGYLAPVPGGVGPLAVACLLENLVKLSNN